MTGAISDILTAERLAAASARLQDLQGVARAGGCLLFGAGNNGRRLARALAASADAPKVHGFISDVAADQGREIEGLPVWSRAAALAAFGAGTLVVNCVFRADVTNSAIMGGLRDSGFHRVAALPAFSSAFGDFLPSFCGYGPVALFAAAAGRIAEAHDLLADAQSRSLFRTLLELRLSLDFSVPRDFDRRIYFPTLIDRRRLADNAGRVVFVDCGAYTGDTVEAFAAWNAGAAAHVIAIEPDPQSFRRLEEVAARTRSPQVAVTCINAAVGRQAGRIGFASQGNEASHIAPDAEATVALVAVDDALRDAGHAAGYVKYDVEGFEREAIAGTAEAIRRHAAPLAVSVYHKPEDFWELPLLLRDMQPDYEFYLREHGPDGVDTVLYALPRRGAASAFSR